MVYYIQTVSVEWLLFTGYIHLPMPYLILTLLTLFSYQTMIVLHKLPGSTVGHPSKSLVLTPCSRSCSTDGHHMQLHLDDSCNHWFVKPC